ncbi:uncharacterized protein LOC143035908 [Oratosquilla oratoria]|uniref:uncharacterized protein LOC143035908 n=1 Tax=Oratosquilla oratoria TaxID=337810 RepID=UPI003F7765A0
MGLVVPQGAIPAPHGRALPCPHAELVPPGGFQALRCLQAPSALRGTFFVVCPRARAYPSQETSSLRASDDNGVSVIRRSCWGVKAYGRVLSPEVHGSGTAGTPGAATAAAATAAAAAATTTAATSAESPSSSGNFGRTDSRTGFHLDAGVSRRKCQEFWNLRRSMQLSIFLRVRNSTQTDFGCSPLLDMLNNV